VASAAAFVAFLTLGAGNAFAFSCDYDGVTDTVTVTMANETVTISKGNLSRILVNGVECDSPPATASNTAFIEIDGVGNGGAGDSVIIDMGGGRFEPGTLDTPEPGLNEIEWELDDINNLTILGDAAADSIVVGEGDGTEDEVFVNLNGDDDFDVLVNDTGDLESLTIRGRGGADFLSGKGGLGTGDAVGADNGPESLTIGLTLDGGDGDDHLQGSENDDVLIGGAGNDTIDGDADTVTTDAQFCGAFIDVATGQAEFAAGGDVVDYSGSTGPITIDLDPNEGHPGAATGDGSDTIQNVEGVVGSPANDTISGDDADNAIAGGAGDDTIAGDAGDDCLVGNDGNDTFDENEGTSTAQGGTGTDNGADLILGQAGLDDTITYSARTTRVNVYLEPLLGGFNETLDDCFEEDSSFFGLIQDGADLDGDGFSFDDESDCVFLDTENAITGSGNDVLVASFVNNRADNEFTAGAGNDLMDGGAGNDTFHEGSAANGADDMDGGTGSDTCDYSARTNPVSVNLDGADNDGEAGEGDNCGGVVDVLDGLPGDEEGDPEAGQDVENVQGGSGNDVLTGDDQANVLAGNAGNDTLSGNGGTDVLQGGDGDDTLDGGAGNDSLDGGAGTDVIDFGSGSAVNVNLSTGTASGQGNDTVTGAENVSGSPGGDVIRGTSGNDVLNGRGGADTIQALAGDDVVNGGDGSDELGAGAGNDRVSGGNGPDTIRGGGGSDRLNGGPANDTLMGGKGNDVLSGGAGRDDHRGGRGTDRCIPGSPGLGNGDTASGCES